MLGYRTDAVERIAVAYAQFGPLSAYPRAQSIRERYAQKRDFAIVVVAEGAKQKGADALYKLDKDAFKGVVKTMPARDDVTLPIREQLIVELYSK